MYRFFLKRVIDIIISFIAIILLSPVLIFLFLILLLTNKGNPLFIQVRPGINGRLFSLIKFKTMNEKKDYNGCLLPDSDRITYFGAFIRKNSLDELPQLFNVLKGEMSIVGPRPLLVEYLPLFTTFQKRRHELKPGITGWAQVNGRNAIDWEQKFKLDIWYVDNYSMYIDLKIIILTFLKVFRNEGVNKDSQTTMDRFKGSIS